MSVSERGSDGETEGRNKGEGSEGGGGERRREENIGYDRVWDCGKKKWRFKITPDEKITNSGLEQSNLIKDNKSES